MEETKRATIYFDAHVHRALRMRAAACNRSISDMVNEAVRVTLAEDIEKIKSLAVDPWHQWPKKLAERSDIYQARQGKARQGKAIIEWFTL